MVVLESRLVRTYKIGLAIVSGLLANPAHAAGGASPSIGGHNVYYGDLHSHTSLSDGSGTPDQAFTHARDAGKLDFFGVSEHDYWPEDMTDQKWNTLKDAANTHNQDGTFVAFWGFEWTSDVPPDGLGLGHFTVVNSEDYCNSTKEPTRTLNQFVTWLSTRDAVAIFNHPGQYNTTFDEFIFDHTDNIVGMELWNRSQDYYSKTGFHALTMQARCPMSGPGRPASLQGVAAAATPMPSSMPATASPAPPSSTTRRPGTTEARVAAPPPSTAAARPIRTPA